MRAVPATIEVAPRAAMEVDMCEPFSAYLSSVLGIYHRADCQVAQKLDEAASGSDAGEARPEEDPHYFAYIFDTAMEVRGSPPPFFFLFLSSYPISISDTFVYVRSSG